MIRIGKVLNMIKVLIVEVNVIMRKFLSDAVNSTNIAVVNHASPNGDLAVMWLEQNKVDIILITTDIDNQMGKDYLKIIQNRFSTRVIVMNDFLDITTMKFNDTNVKSISEKLKTALEAISVNKVNKIVISETFENDTEIKHSKNEAWNADIVLIASSTGGPVALEKVFGMLPKDFSKPVLIVQHMPTGFTSGLAKIIDRVCKMKVVEGKSGDEIVDGKAILAPGGYHMVVSQNNTGTRKIELLDTDYVNGVKPSADVLFKSISEVYAGRNILAVILTGMGRDGSEGVKELKKRCSCYCITQTISTCVAYGMPNAVRDIGLSDKEVDLELMAGEIYKMAGRIW